MSKYLLLFLTAFFITNCNANKKSALQSSQEEIQTSDSAQVKLQKIRPGVWIHTSHYTFKGKTYPSNGLVVEAGDSLYLIDPAWGVANTRALLHEIERNIGLPISRAVATHFHSDRVAGVDFLEKKGIEVYTHPKTPSLAKAAENAVPNHTFAKLQQPGSTVSFGPLEIFYPGHAHTVDNIMVWLPGQKILYGGCAVRAISATTMGNTSDGDLSSWVKAIKRAKKRYPKAEIVVPGHGAYGGIDLLNHTLTLLKRANTKNVKNEK